MKEYACDVLVIGGGGAGLRAAIAAAEKDSMAKIILALKGKLGISGVTATACSDRMAFHVTLPFTQPVKENNWKYHAEDIYKLGGYASDEDLAQILAKNSREAFEYLDRLGVPWIKKGDKPDQFLTDGSMYARACYTGPYTAIHIEEVLIKRIKETQVKIMENIFIVDLIISSSENRVVGALGLDEKDNPIIFKSKATILATGGAGEVFAVSVYPREMTGDGYAMAYRAGADLVNMEFIQIGLSSVATKLACSGSMMRAIPRFVNDKGEEFLEKYFPRNSSLSEIYLTVFQKGASWPISFEHKSHLIDIAVYKEIREGKKVYLDYTRNPKNLKWEELREISNWYKKVKGIDLLSGEELRKIPLERLRRINPEILSWFEKRGFDLMKEGKIEIAPAAQHFQGGVKIRRRAETSVKGLFAAGECAGGQHGANRPGGNALLDCQVFGKIAGLSAIEEAGRIGRYKIESKDVEKIYNILKDLNCESKGEKALLVRSQIQELLFSHASIIRTEEGLSKAFERLREVEREGISVDEKSIKFALETLNLLKVAQMVVGSAMIRKESRGPHIYYRRFEDPEPLPKDDNSWKNKYIVIRKRGEKMQFEIKSVVVVQKSMNHN